MKKLTASHLRTVCGGAPPRGTLKRIASRVQDTPNGDRIIRILKKKLPS